MKSGRTIGTVLAILAIGMVLWGLTRPPEVTANSGQWLDKLQTLAQADEKKTTEQTVVEMAGPKLVKTNGSSVMSDYLNKKDYILVYFSAHWCPPCRAFTPQLVKFYNEYAEEGNFEVVFVSNDQSRDMMMKYMREDKMPWVAVPFDKRNGGLSKAYAESGIPNLVMVKPDGTVVSSSFKNGGYVGPYAVVKDLVEKLQEKEKEAKPDNASGN